VAYFDPLIPNIGFILPSECSFDPNREVARVMSYKLICGPISRRMRFYCTPWPKLRRGIVILTIREPFAKIQHV